MSLSGNGDVRNGHLGRVALYHHAYKYFPYEKELARKEIRQAIGISKVDESSGCFRLLSCVDKEKLRTLTYVAKIVTSTETFSTVQQELEETYRNVTRLGRRQATRYSAHGLHEYKGRFNPQLVRFLLNYLGAESGTKVLDPFCGSGTTLVEAALYGCSAVGLDMNPLSVFLSNAKISALELDAGEVNAALYSVLAAFKEDRPPRLDNNGGSRLAYLSKWFPKTTLAEFETLRICIHQHGGRSEAILLALVSNMLRDYSLQEPADLRIRRRISPLPDEPLMNTFEAKASEFVRCLGVAQRVTGLVRSDSAAVVEDSRDLGTAVKRSLQRGRFDLVITSPPYATALPYIDTQRLSLVWLGLCSVDDIRRLDGDAIGSREMGHRTKDFQQRLQDNADDLPLPVFSFCQQLQRSLDSKKDGFRRKAVPMVVYRYFSDMQRVFTELSRVLGKGTKFASVVGTNKTTLGGKPFDINTPQHLVSIARKVGFHVKESIPLQTYQRYGIHQKNSIRGETLTIMELQ